MRLIDLLKKEVKKSFGLDREEDELKNIEWKESLSKKFPENCHVQQCARPSYKSFTKLVNGFKKTIWLCDEHEDRK